MANLTTFESFTKLPNEIQDMVWDIALSEVHQVIRYTLKKPQVFKRGTWRHMSIRRSISPFIHACARSRERAKRHFTQHNMEHRQIWSCKPSNVPNYEICQVEQRLPQELPMQGAQPIGQWWNPDNDFILVQEGPRGGDHILDIASNCPKNSVCNVKGIWCVRVFDSKIKYVAIGADDWNSYHMNQHWLLHFWGIEYIFVIANRRAWTRRDTGQLGHNSYAGFNRAGTGDWTYQSDDEWKAQKQQLQGYSRGMLRDFAVRWERKSASLEQLGYIRYDEYCPVDKDDLLRIATINVQVVESEDEIKRFIASQPKGLRTSFGR